jgi:hypothetical protein
MIHLLTTHAARPRCPGSTGGHGVHEVSSRRGRLPAHQKAGSIRGCGSSWSGKGVWEAKGVEPFTCWCRAPETEPVYAINRLTTFETFRQDHLAPARSDGMQTTARRLESNLFSRCTRPAPRSPPGAWDLGWVTSAGKERGVRSSGLEHNPRTIGGEPGGERGRPRRRPNGSGSSDVGGRAKRWTTHAASER